MELIELKKELEEINKRITEFKTSLKIEDKTERVAEIENMMLESDFWNNSETASLLVTESKSIKKELDEFSEMVDYLEHSEEMVEFLNIVRFKNNKSRYLVELRELMTRNGELQPKKILSEIGDTFEKRK